MTIEKQTYRSGPFKDIFAQGVKVGNALHLSGQVGIDASGTAGADIATQTKLAYENIRHVLLKFGATMNNIVDETMFVTSGVATNCAPPAAAVRIWPRVMGRLVAGSSPAFS